MTFLLLIIAGFVFLTSCNNTSEDVYFSVVFVDENDALLRKSGTDRFHLKENNV